MTEEGAGEAGHAGAGAGEVVGGKEKEKEGSKERPAKRAKKEKEREKERGGSRSRESSPVGGSAHFRPLIALTRIPTQAPPPTQR